MKMSTITVYNRNDVYSINFTGKWLLHPLSFQSGKTVYLDGNASGVVAASDNSEYGVEYLICANMTAVTPADNPACSFDLYNNDCICCPCTASPCHLGLDLRMNKVTVTDSEELGLSTDGCNFTTSKEQRLLFFARHSLDHSSSLVYQLSGFADVKPSPSATPTSDITIITSIVGSVIALFAVVLSILLCIAAVAGYKYGKTRRNRQNTGIRSTMVHLNCTFRLIVKFNVSKYFMYILDSMGAPRGIYEALLL